MITAELSPGSFRPVDLVQWTRDGKVQVRHCRVVDDHRVLGVYRAVPVMQLVHDGGRAALARDLARLPRSEA